MGMVPLFFSALEDDRSFPDAPIETTSAEAFALEGGEHWATVKELCLDTVERVVREAEKRTCLLFSE